MKGLVGTRKVPCRLDLYSEFPHLIYKVQCGPAPPSAVILSHKFAVKSRTGVDGLRHRRRLPLPTRESVAVNVRRNADAGMPHAL